MGARRRTAESVTVNRGSRIRKLLAPAVVFALVAVGLLQASPAAAASVLSLDVTIRDAATGQPVTSINAQSVANYDVKIDYSCSVDPCTGVTVHVDPTPKDSFYNTYRKEIGDPTFIPPSPGITATGSADAGWDVNVGSMAAGATGSMTFRYNVGSRVVPVNGGSFFLNNSPITPRVTISSNGATPVVGTANATWASSLPTAMPTFNVNGGSTTLTDTPLTVTLGGDSRCLGTEGSTTRGFPYWICAQSWTSTVQLPAKAQYVAGSGGTYDPVARTVTFSHSGETAARGIGYSGIDRDFQVIFPSNEYPSSGTGCSTTETFTATSSVTYLEGTTRSAAAASYSPTVGNCAPFPGLVTLKQSAASVEMIPLPGQTSTGGIWELYAYNTSNVIGQATIADDALNMPDIPVWRVVASPSSTAVYPITLQYTLDNGTTGTTSLTAASPTFEPAGRTITAITATSSTLPASKNVVQGGSDRSSYLGLGVYFRVPDTATPGTRTNTATFSMSYPGNPQLATTTATDSGSVELRQTVVNTNTRFVANSVLPQTGGTTPVVGSTIPWNVNAVWQNVPAGTQLTPQYMFLAPLGWEVTGGYRFVPATTDPGVTATTRTVTYNGNTYSAIVFDWPGAVTQSGNFTLPTIQVDTKPTGAAVAGIPQTAYLLVGDVNNGVVTTYSPTQHNDSTDLDGDGQTTDVFALRTGNTTLAPTLSALPIKEICQADTSEPDGCNWISDPGSLVGVTPSATGIKYRITIRNTGNAPLTNLVAYDVLPYIGDTGTTTDTAGTPRGSTVQEVLASVTDRPADVLLTYSTSTNPPRPEVYSGTTTGDWSAPLVGASALRISIANLPVGQSRSFVYEASLIGGSADQVACNSIAIAASSMIASEPSPVCATTQEADLIIETLERYPLQEGRVGVVPFEVENDGGGAVAPATVTISVPAGVSIVDLVVSGWNCTTPSMAGPVDVTCEPVNPDGTERLLQRDVLETIPLKVLPGPGTGDTELCFPGLIEGLIFDPELENNEAEGCTQTFAPAALEVVKTDGVAVAAVGDTLTYTITARNLLVAEGLVGAVVTDRLPAGVRFVSASDGGALVGADANGTGGTVTWPAVNLAAAGTPSLDGDNGAGAPGSSITRTVTVQVVPSASGQVVNTARMTATDPADAGTQLQDEGSDIDDLRRLTVAKSSDAAAAGVRSGDVVTYTVTLTNSGTSAYPAGSPATLVDDLSAVLDDATFVAGSATASVNGGGAIAVADPVSGRLSWSGALPVGQSVVVTYQVTVGNGTTGDDVLTNTAYAASTPTSCVNGLTPAGISCATVSTPFAPTLAKTIVSSVQNDDGTWTTMYGLVVTNSSPTTSATYNLSDSLAFGAGITVVSAAVTSAPAGVTPAAWSGSGSIATGVNIPANTQHTYQITVTANAGTTAGTPAGTCTTGVAGGFANRATLATTDGRTAAADACAAPAEPIVDKTAGPATQLPDGRWSVVYTVTVRNPNPAPADLAYTLDDVLAVPAGVTVDDVVVTGPGGAPLNASFDGMTDTALLTGVDRIPAATPTTPSARVFTITVILDASAAGGAGLAALSCPPAGTGGYQNDVTLRSGTSATVLDTAEACTDALPLPTPTIVKTVTSSAVDTNGIWTVNYEIQVTNPDPVYSTRYTLEDELQFAAGTTVQDTGAASGDASTSATWDGQGDSVVATNIALPGGAAHRYSVTVVVDPGTIDLDSPLADCRLDAGETGTGFRNIATVTAGVKSVFSEACEPINDPSVVKTTVAAPSQDSATGIWSVQYHVTVKNRSTTTVGTIPYTLTDALDFPADVEIIDVDVDAPTGATANPDFDGVTDTELGSGGVGAAEDDTTPATQVFVVSVEFTVPAGLTDGAACDPAQGPGGLRNEVEIGVGARVSGAVACADAPDVPVPGATKTVTGQEQQADGTWRLTYEITVANPSGTITSTYSLEDEFALGDGIVLDEPSTVDAPSGVTVDPAWDGDADTMFVENILLPGGASHTYTITAVLDSGSVRGTDPAGDCILDAGETGTGFSNSLTLDTGVATVDASACVTGWDPAVSKELNGVPVQQPDGSWLLSYTMTVTNPTGSADLRYGLVDELDFPTGTTVTVESAAGRPGAPDVEADWDGITQTQLVADGALLAANAQHVFDVTVRAVLPAGQDSQPGGWGNLARVESGVDQVISSEAEATADILLPELEIAKAVTVEDPVLRIGDTVEYEITIENTGEGNYTALFPAIVWDDLTDVLDDSDLAAGPAMTPDTGVIVPVGDRYRWSAPLQSGEIVTLTYTAVVAPGGDANLVNIAFVPSPAAADPTTPALDECAGEECSSTVTAMPALDIEKTASTTTTSRGDVVEYTVRVTNTGGVDLPVTDPARMSDNLSDVLDNASYNNDATASSGTTAFAASTLAWEGALPAGQTVTITYSVTVDEDAANGSELRNVATSDPTLIALAIGTDDETPGVAATTTTVMALAVTGSGAVGFSVLVALMLLFAGIVLSRRRRFKGRLLV